jgi:hypothetical protein
MKRATILAAFGLLAAIAGNSQQAKKTDVESDGLKGNVKSCLVENADLVSKFGAWVEGARRCIMLTLYDSKGNQTESDNYAAEGYLESKTVFTYDSKGNWTTEVEQELVTKFGKTYWEPTGKATTHRTIEYYP